MDWACEDRPACAMERELVRTGKKLDRMVRKKEAAGALDLLHDLKRMPMTLALLRSTKIGVSVNALRKHCADEGVTSLARSLIKSWKKVAQGPATGRDSGPKNKDSPVTSPGSPEAREQSRCPSGKGSHGKAETDAGDAGASSLPEAPGAPLSVRLKCREMLAAALRTGERGHAAIRADHEELASRIEEAIFREVGNTGVKYKNRVRSRIFNLKDAKNPKLRENVLCGNIPPHVLATMTAQEMASDELKELRKSWVRRSVSEHQVPKTQGTRTDLFTCGKCRKNNCAYTQLQTRSADEPMTTLVVCNECGHRWKFC